MAIPTADLYTIPSGTVTIYIGTSAPTGGGGGGGSGGGSYAPSSNSGYLTSATYLIQPVNMSYPARIAGGVAYDPSIWGPTWDYAELRTGWQWTNPGGDWIDAAGTSQGTVPFVSFATLPLGSTVAQRYTGVDCTALVQYAQTHSRWLAVRWAITGGQRALAGGDTPGQAAPQINVTYSDGTTAVLAHRVTAQIASGDRTPGTRDARYSLPCLMEFERPTKAVASATLDMSIVEHWSGTSNVQAFLLDPPINSAAVTTGIAATAADLDADLASKPNIIGVMRFQNGSVLSDFVVPGAANWMNEANYDPAIWGGASDTSKWPHTVVGKFINPPAGLSLVSDAYTGEGFAPIAPGLGALRLSMPAEVVADGDEVGTSGTEACNMVAMLAEPDFGNLDHMFVRCWARLGTPAAAAPADRKHVLSGGVPTWTSHSGKWGISPDHNNSYGGNSLNSGGGRGWQMRWSWYECTEALNGPQEKGWAIGYHLGDFNYANPAGYNYGGTDQQAAYENWGQLGGIGGFLYAGRWAEVETELKLNTCDFVANTWSADGILRVWLDGRLVYERTNMIFRTAPRLSPAYVAGAIRPCRQLGIKQLWMNWFHGGKTKNTVGRTIFYGALAWGKARIGPLKFPAAIADTTPWITAATRGTWGVIPGGATIASLDPEANAALNPNYPAFAPWRGSGGIDRQFSAWASLAFDQTNGRGWIPNGNGHTDNRANTVFAWDLNQATPTWRLVKAPSIVNYNDGLESTGVYSDGRPRATHVYNGAIYIPGMGPAVVNEVGLSQSGGYGPGRLYIIDETTGLPTFKAAAAESNGGGSCGCWDSVRGVAWSRKYGTQPLRYLNPVGTNSWVTVGPTVAHNGNESMVHMPDSDCLLLGNGSMDASTNTVYQTVTGGWYVVDAATGTHYYPTFTGASALGSTYPSGLMPGMCQLNWDPVRRCAYAWDMSAGHTTEIMRLTPGTNPRTDAWTIDTIPLHASNAVTPSAAQPNGTYGRAFYWQAKDVFVVINDVTHPGYFFRMP